jgi:hypothetical protein
VSEAVAASLPSVARAARPTLLVNHVYWQNVGHAVEALRYTLGYHLANPEWRISLALNRHTPLELARLCPWISNVYPLDVQDADGQMSLRPRQQIPPAWDYVVSDQRGTALETSSEALFGYYEAMKRYLRVRCASGYCGDDAVPYRRHQQLTLKLPHDAVSWASGRVRNTSVKIAVLFAGHKKRKYFPTSRSWRTVLDALYDEYGGDVSTYFIGKLKRDDLRTASAVERRDVDELLARYPRSVDCFDAGILRQLAVVQACDLFVSPHTGFGFAVLAVGTPWLTLSGGPFPEYFYNGVPFFSVLPDREWYPAYGDSGCEATVPEDDQEVIVSMSRRRITEDLPTIVEAAKLLVAKRWSYEMCMAHHFAKLERFYGGPDRIYSFDDVHEQWLTREPAADRA